MPNKGSKICRTDGNIGNLRECIGSIIGDSLLKGRENMSLNTLSKLEDTLGISLIYDEQVASPSMVAEEVLA